MADPVVDVATYLGSESSLTLGSDLFYGLVRAPSDVVPIRSVFVLGYPGPKPLRVLGTAKEVRKEPVQVMVRSSGYEDGYTLAREAYRVLQSATMAGYMDLQARQSEPIYLGEDERFLHHWSINLLSIYEE